jgi:hypothetical protein
MGGLKRKRGTTTAAWTAMIVGAVNSGGGVLVKQITSEGLADPES